jgi:transposase-like protein
MSIEPDTDPSNFRDLADVGFEELRGTQREGQTTERLMTGEAPTFDRRALAASAGSFLPEDVARTLLEQLRWPDGPICPHCGSAGAYRLHPKAASARPVRGGVLKCKACRRQFTVTVGTAFARSHLGLNKWFLAIAHFCRGDKNVSGSKLEQLLGVSPHTARLLGSRVRRVLTLSGTRTRAGEEIALVGPPFGRRGSPECPGTDGLPSSGSAPPWPDWNLAGWTKPGSRAVIESRAFVRGMSFVEALATMIESDAAGLPHYGNADPRRGRPGDRPTEQPASAKTIQGMAAIRRSRLPRCPEPVAREPGSGLTRRDDRAARAERRGSPG